MSSIDSGDEPQVTKPPVPRSRPGRPAASARRAGDDTGGNGEPTNPSTRQPARPHAPTTVAESPLDDTLETERPTVVPPDPLLRAKAAGSRTSPRRNGSGGTRSNGNGTSRSNGSKSNGATRNGAAARVKHGNGTTDVGAQTASEPIEAAAVEATSTDTAELAPVEAPAADATEAPNITARATPAEPVRGIEPDPVVEASDTDAAVRPGATATDHTLPPPSSLASPVLHAPPQPDPQPLPDPPSLLDRPVVGSAAPSPASEPEPPSGSDNAPSRWSLRNLLNKVSTTGRVPEVEGEIDAVPGPGVKPRVRSSSSPITSPIPVQPSPLTGEALAAVAPEATRSFVQPFGLMPAQPPYIRPTPSFDPGLLRTGPVELDPALDPDLPQRAPRIKPVQVPAVRRRGRPRMRRVTRVVRHVDPWSVFKVALCFSLVLYGVCLTAGVLLWNVAYTTGTIDNVQRFFESFGWDTFRFKGGELYHNAWIAGLFCAIGLTGMIVLAATLFNLITDLVGGIRVTVLEEEVIERDPAERRTLLRRRGRHTTSTVPSQARRDDEETVELYEHFG